MLQLTSLRNAIVPYSVQWGIAISNLAFYPLLLACVVCVEKWYDISVVELIFRRKLWERVEPRLQRFKLVYKPLLAVLTGAFACSFLGNVWSNPGNALVVSGFELRKVGAILFSLAVIGLFAVVINAIFLGTATETRRDPIILQILVIIPFMLVRNVATVVESFLSNLDEPYFNEFIDLGLIRIPDFGSLTILSIFGVTILKRSQRKEMKKIAREKGKEIKGAQRAGSKGGPKGNLLRKLFKREPREEDKADIDETANAQS